MPHTDTRDQPLQSTRFLWLYALAVAGGAIAYIPFLTILLPLHVTQAKGHAALPLLAHLAFYGAIAASGASILFGWLSDISRARRPWIVAGLLLSSALLVAMPMTTSPMLMTMMILGWQLFLNMMLAPLSAWAGDLVPDRQKGMLGGLLALAPALGALSGTLVTWQGLVPAQHRHIALALLVCAMVAPVLLWGRPVAMPQLAPETDARARLPLHWNGRVARMWLARLLVQIAEASLFAFLLLWFRSVDPTFADHDIANIFTAVLCAAVVLTLIVGRWSDRNDRPIRPLTITAAFAAAGLLVMAAGNSVAVAVAGYALFGLASAIFLALHSSQTLRVLPSVHRRGRDLGLFNLTNTMPSMVMPWLTLALVPAYGFNALFLLLAGLAAFACGILMRMPPPKSL